MYARLVPWLGLSFIGVLPACSGGDGSGDGAADTGGSEDPDDTSPTGSEDPDDTGSDCTAHDVAFPNLDNSACAAAAADYTPTVDNSASDMWPTCANDDGEYHPLEQPGSAARTDAFEMMRSILASDLSPQGFTGAREQYALDQGIESRTVRREDVHYPNIPEAEQDTTVDFDKQCTIADLVTKYPDRCAGPAKIAPIINDAFQAGQTEQGDPAVHAARIDAAIMWFMYLSTLKEATFSCPPADYAGDCDAAWGYYNGGVGRSGGKGFAADVTAVDASANDRVFDGLAAMRCWRDAYPADMDGDTSDPLFVAGRDQLDRANNYAAAIVLRDRITRQPKACGSESDANWAWVQTFGQALAKPAQDADAGQAATLALVLSNDAPTDDDLLDAVAAIDALFPCP